jgi:cell volume regulation protein A
MGLGTACGYIFGKLMIYITNKIKLDIEGLYPVLILSMVFFTFSFTNFIGGNGFLAIYIAAIILGSSNFIHKKSLMKFYDGQAWLMQIIMFLTLGLLVFPSQIVPFIAVFIALARANLRWRKKLFISWVGLRGAVPIVFAIYPLIAGIENAHMIFNLVFFISVSSVLVQGTMLPVVAKWLKVSVPEKLKRKFPLDIEIKDDLKAELLELDIPADSPIAGKAVVELDLPRSALIVLIHRDGKYLTVRGDTVIEGNDHLLIMADTKDVVKDIYACFQLRL